MPLVTCQELAEFLADYSSGELSWRQWLAFQIHLGLCRECRIYLSTYRTTILLARETQTAAAFNECGPVPEALIKAVLAARGAKTGDS